jgi:hypothetical protein
MGLEKYESPARDRNESRLEKFYISANCPMFDFDWRFHSFTVFWDISTKPACIPKIQY